MKAESRCDIASLWNSCSYFSSKPYVVTPHLNRLVENSVFLSCRLKLEIYIVAALVLLNAPGGHCIL